MEEKVLLSRDEITSLIRSEVMSELRRHNLIMGEHPDDDEGTDQIYETNSRQSSGSILHKYRHSVNNSRSIKSYRQHSHTNPRDEFYDNKLGISKCDIISADNKEQHQRQMALLPPDTYSFMVFVPLFSPAFFLAICYAMMMYFAWSSIIMNSIFSGKSSEGNILGVLPYTDWQMRVIQFLAIFLAIAWQTTLLWGVNTLFRGYNQADFEPYFNGGLPKRLKLRWAISVGARITEGLLYLVAIFMLIMRSETTKDVIYISAATSISDTFEFFFRLLSWGYFGTRVKDAADHPLIGEVDYSQVYKSRRYNLKLLRSLTLFSIWLSLVSVWAFIHHKQTTGEYFTNSAIYVQLGDDELPSLGLLSGIFDVKVDFSDVLWIARENADFSIKQFRYCWNDKVWVFEAHALRTPVDYDPCVDWVLKSNPTRNYDLLSVSSSDWQVNADHPYYSLFNQLGEIRLGVLQMKSLIMQPWFECPSDKYGPKCEFGWPCEKISVDGATFSSVEVKAIYGIMKDEGSRLRPWFFQRTIVEETGITEYDLLLDDGNLVLMYEYPVYYSKIDLSSSTAIVGTADDDKYDVYNFICCVGRRWAKLLVAVYLPTHEESDVYILSQTVRHLQEMFKQTGVNKAAYRFVTHLSEEFNINTEDDTGMPIGLQFYELFEADFKPYLPHPAPGMLICSCPVCSVSDELRNHSFSVTYALSPLFGENYTCNSLVEASKHMIRGSLKCDGIKLASIFECGCPYEIPEGLECSLCTDGSIIKDSFLDILPYPNGGLFPQSSCGELSVGMLFNGLEMQYNEHYCPAMQTTFGSLCGCSYAPPPPCEIKCPIKGHVFDEKQKVAVFSPNTIFSGWYCGEIRGFMSDEKWQYCTDEMSSSLADECCVPPSD